MENHKFSPGLILNNNPLRGHRPWAVLLLLALVAGCATTERPSLEELDEAEIAARWEQRQEVLATLTSWSLQGKMAVKSGPESGSATLKWSVSEEVENIELYGPLGGGRVMVQVNPNGAYLEDSEGTFLIGRNASDVLYEHLGWQVPFTQMKNWARGLPGENATDIVIDDQGRLESLVQEEWRVEYEDYQVVRNSAIPGLILPYSIKVNALPGTMEVYTDDGELLGDEFQVQLLLKRWWEIGVGE